MNGKLKEDNELQTKNYEELSYEELDDLLDKLEREGYGVWPYNDEYRGMGFHIYSGRKKLTRDGDIFYFLTVNLDKGIIRIYKTFNPNILSGKEVDSIEFDKNLIMNGNSASNLDTIIHDILDKLVPSNTIIDYKENLEEEAKPNAFNPGGKETTYGRFKIINNDGVYTLVNRKGNSLKISNARNFDDVKKEIDNELSKGAFFVPRFYYEDLEEDLKLKEDQMDYLSRSIAQKTKNIRTNYENIVLDNSDDLLDEEDNIWKSKKTGDKYRIETYHNRDNIAVKIFKLDNKGKKALCIQYSPDYVDGNVILDYSFLSKIIGNYEKESGPKKDLDNQIVDMINDANNKGIDIPKKYKALNYEKISSKKYALSELSNYLKSLDDSSAKQEEGLKEEKTFTFPNLRQAIDYYWKDRDANIEKVSIKQLVDDNNLLNDNDLQSYHQRQWDNKPAKEFHIDKSKVNSMRLSEVPYVVRHKDGTLELGDGRHRTRALHNDGYDYVELPVINEGLLVEAKVDIDNFINKFGQDTYDLFKKSLQRLKNNKISTDLTWHVKNTSKEELDNILHNLQAKVKTSEPIDLSKGIPGKYKYLGEKDGYKVYQPLDYISSMALGVNTGWCTTGRYGHYGEPNFKPSEEDAKQHFNEYTSQGVKFYYFLNSKTMYGEYAIAVYPRTLDVYKRIDNDTYLKSINFELFDAEDGLNYAAVDKLPLDLLGDVLKITKIDADNDGLGIENSVVMFANPEVKNVVIPKGVVGIWTGAFYGCRNITSITIPNAITSIGERAFFNCSSLTSITIPEGVTSIGSYTFYGCNNLTSISIPNSVTSIGSYVFTYCDSLTNIKIPKGVTSIGIGAFHNCSSLTSITMPDSVTSIGDSVFSGCSSLTSITIPDDVISIGNNAFYECSSLKSIVIPNSVTTIREGAFYNCKLLTIYTDNDYVKEYASERGIPCKPLNEFKEGLVESNNNEQELDAQIEEDLTDEEQSLLDRVDNFITRLYELRQSSIKEEGEFGTGNLVFKEFRNLGYLDNLKKLKTKLQGKEMSLEGLEEGLLLEKGTDYKKQASKIISNSGLFDEETSRKIIDALFQQDIHAFNHAPAWLEKYLKGIARMLVEYCNGDKSKAQEFLTQSPNVFDYYLNWVKDNREKVGSALDDEFNNKLSYDDLLKKVEEIQGELDKQSKDKLSQMEFNNKSNYTLVPIDSYDQMHALYGGNATGDGSDEEGQYAGRGGTSWCHTNSEATYNSWVDGGKNKFFVLQNNDWEDIPFDNKSNLKTNGKDAYGNSLIALLVSRKGRLKNATLRCNHVGILSGADNQYKTYAELSEVAGFNVEEEIKKYFPDYGNDQDGEFVIENGTLLEIDDDTRVEIKKAVIPNGVKTIGNYAFSECWELEEVILPEGLEVIGNKAFKNCEKLKKVVMPNSVTLIGESSFSGCIRLNEINLSTNLTYIGTNAFYRCVSLSNITLPESLESIGENAFVDTPLKTITIPKNVKVFGDSIFNTCEKLESVTINAQLKIIPYSSFFHCLSLKEVNIPNSVRMIEPYAFAECDALTSLTISSDGIEISSNAFSFSALKQLVIKGASSIYSNAFTGRSQDLVIYSNDEYVRDYCETNHIKYSPLNEGLHEELLVEGIKEVQAKYPNIDGQTFMKLISLDPTYKQGVDSVGTYGKWILNLFNKGKLDKSKFSRLKELLNDFNERKKWFKNKDIGQFKSIEDLEKGLNEVEIGELSNRQKERQFKKEIKNTGLNASKVYEDDKWEVWVPNDYESSCKLATNTQWCTGPSSHGNRYYYDYYTSQGYLYIVINKENSDEKYQFHFPSEQYMDRYDHRLDVQPFYDKNPGLAKFLDQEEELAEQRQQEIAKKKVEEVFKEFQKGNMKASSYLNQLTNALNNVYKDDISKVFEKDSPYAGYYDVALPNFVVEVDKGDIAEAMSGRDMSEDFVMKCLDGDVWDSFNSYYDDNSIDNVDASNIDNSTEQDLVSYGLPEDILEKVIRGEDLGEYEDYRDDLEIALMRADDEARTAGAVNECEQDFDSSFNYILEMLSNRNSVNPVKAEGLYSNEKNIKFTGLTFEHSLVPLNEYLENDWQYYSDSFVDCLSHSLAQIFEKADFSEPRYGWYGYDVEAFNDRLQQELYDIFG